MPLETRERCYQCHRARLNCYCRHIQPFDPGIRFVILIQYREARKHVATGRLSHLSLRGSELLVGYDYTYHPRVNEILADPRYFPLVLYPGPQSTNLTRLSLPERALLVPEGKEPVVFVIDGTWINARKTMERSANLRPLPRLSFDPPRLSRFRLRKQPQAHCLATVEAIHETIELLGPAFDFPVGCRAHDNLLHAFDRMEERQIELARPYKPRFLERRAKT